MALQGNLRDFSVSEILQLLGTQKKSGCLLLKRDAESVVIYVSDGRVIAAREPGMRADDPLVAFLRTIHRLSEEQYRGLLTLHRETGRDLEDLLLNGRYMEQDELASHIERQILDTLLRLSQWENGSYRFDPAILWQGARPVRLSTEGILIEAARRVDENRRFRAMFGDPHRILAVRDLPDPDEPLGDEERELFGVIDGQRTLAEVTVVAPLTEYETLEALHRMVEARWVELLGRRAPGAAAGDPSRRAAGTTTRPVANELFALALALVVVAGLMVCGHVLRRPSQPTPGVPDVFVATQLRDLRKVLDLYQREYGGYPERLDQLVEDRWLSAHALEIPGHRLDYRREDAGADYRLRLERAR